MMSLPNSNHAQGAKRTIDSDHSAAMKHDSQTIVESRVDAASQESQQTLDSQNLVSSGSVPQSSVAYQSDVRTLDSRDFDSNQASPNADAEQTYAEPPDSAEFLKTGDRSKVPEPVPPANRPRRAARGTERYVLVENFAHGGLGNLWRAEDTAIRREVAFKELLPKALRNPVHVERFIEEAQISGQLEHPGIIPIYDVGFQENGTPYYAMKMVRGGNMEVAIEALHKLPKESPERQLAFNRLLRQFIAVCQAVGFAHDKGVLHRDLKPLNVMLGEFGETLVLDWGLAKLVDVIGEQMISSTRSENKLPDEPPGVNEEQSDLATITLDASQNFNSTKASVPDLPRSAFSLEATQADTTGPYVAKSQGTAKAQTQIGGNRTHDVASASATGHRPVQTGQRSVGSETIVGQVMGTPTYMSPEQALGQNAELDARTDIYSLGGILYKLLTNQQPVGRGRVKEVIAKVIAGLIPPPRTIDPAIPKPLEAICLKALSKEKEARYPKALDLAADVEAWLADQPVSAYPDPWQERMRRWSKRHRTLIVSSSAMLMVLIGSILFAERAAANRLNRIRNEARAKIADARVATNQSEFAEAEKLLAAAKGLVDTEPQLGTERQAIETQVADLNRMREVALREHIAGIRNAAKLKLAEAQQAIHVDQDFPQAKLLLTEVAEKLASEPALSDLEQTARTQLKSLDQFESFVKEVELARIFGGNISGDESLDEIRESKRHALIASNIFEIDFDQPDKAGPGLRVLGEIAISKWRDRIQEVLVTLAYLEPKLALRDNEAELRAAAQLGLGHLQQAERLGLSSQAMWYLRRDLYSALNQKPAAQHAKQFAESLQPTTRLDFYLLGELARAEGRFADAVAAYQDALRIDPADFWSLNMLGLCSVQLRQFEAAISSYTACIAQRPQFHWPYLARGVAFGQLQRFAAAHHDFAKSLELEPESYHAHLNRGAVSVLQQKYASAQADFDKASQLKPDQSAPYLNLALVHYEQAEQIIKASNELNADVLAKSEYQQALVALTAAAERSARQPGIYAFRGAIHLALNDLGPALVAYERAIQLESNAVRRAAHSKQIGLIHARSGRYSEAITAYDRSLTDNADDHEVIRWRAEAAMPLERYDEAVRGFSSFLGKAGPVAEVYQARATALTKLGRSGEAINDYTMFLQLAPQNEQAAQMLALRGRAYLSESNKLGKADFEEAIRLNPRNPNHFHGLARARVFLGDYAEAIATLEESSKLTRQVVEQVGAKAWPFVYNPATIYALASAKVLLDAKLPLDKRKDLAQKYTQNAVELLREAYQLAGPQFQNKLAEYVRTDSELDPIRQAPEFLEALKTFNGNKAPKSDPQKPD